MNDRRVTIVHLTGGASREQTPADAIAFAVAGVMRAHGCACDECNELRSVMREHGYIVREKGQKK